MNYKTTIDGKKSRYFTNVEKAWIFKYYLDNEDKKNGKWLDELADSLGRPKTNISRYARKKGLTTYHRFSDTVLPERKGICKECKTEITIARNRKKDFCSKNCRYMELTRIQSKRSKEWYRTNPHPKGMLGKKHSQEFSVNQSERVKRLWLDKNSKFNSVECRKKKSKTMRKLIIERLHDNPSSVYSRTTKGWREFGDGKKYFFRSKWEMNYAYYLEWLKQKGQIKDWTYEEKTFWFEKIKRGVRSYTPDFFITNNNHTTEFHEVKGWFDPKSLTKIKRMKLYYPQVKILIIDEDQYKTLKKQVSRLCNWE